MSGSRAGTAAHFAALFGVDPLAVLRAAETLDLIPAAAAASNSSKYAEYAHTTCKFDDAPDFGAVLEIRHLALPNHPTVFSKQK